MNISWLNPDTLIDIIETASQLILQIYLGCDFVIETKDDNSPLTIADKKANEYICSNLKTYYPTIPIISEEIKNEPYSIRKNYTFAWIIDPLDGTKEFIKKNGEFTVNIGLIHNGVPVAGFVNIPVKGLTYWAIEGQGAFIKEINKDTHTSINEIRNKHKSRKTRVLASRSHMNNETESFIEKLGDVELMNVGSSIKIIWIAENTADVYPRLSPCMEWDTCAAHAILREVGGLLLEYKDNELRDDLRYNKESLYNPNYVCYGPNFINYKLK